MHVTTGHPLYTHQRDALDTVARRLSDWLSEYVDDAGKDGTTIDPQLAPQEVECLHFLMRGQTYKQIAYRTTLSTRTVEGYIASAMKKLEAEGRIDAVFRAIKLGYINPE